MLTVLLEYIDSYTINLQVDSFMIIRPVARGGAVGVDAPPSQIKGPLF